MPTTVDANAAAAVSTTITTLPIVVNTDPAIVKTNLTHTIAKGNAGNDVKAVQQRLDRPRLRPRPGRRVVRIRHPAGRVGIREVGPEDARGRRPRDG